MADVIKIDQDKIYTKWREYLLAHSGAKHFGVVSDKSVAQFPYSNLMMVGRPTNVTDLENHEVTVDLTYQTDSYTDSKKISILYEIDDACWEFFNELGFRRMGDSMVSEVSNSNVKRITSRFTLRNFNGRFLKNLDAEEPIVGSGAADFMVLGE